MPSSVYKPEHALTLLAERLTGEPILRIDALRCSGNNRLYCVRTAAAKYALKAYADAAGGAQRLQREYAALEFLGSTPAARSVPRALALDRSECVALYEWIDGSELRAHDVADVDAALAFIAGIHAARTNPAARAFANATEAIISADGLVAQLAGRIRGLHAAVAGHPAAAFLSELERRCVVYAEACRRSALLAGVEPQDEIAADARTLSPSDFSFHNALRRADGSLAFVDFEYFGWDDPVKLVADFLWHPAMRISAEEGRQFVRGAQAIFGPTDPDYARRLRSYFPLLGLKWCLIILNEFLADDWSRRQFSGENRAWDDVRARQLCRARGLLEEIVAGTREGVLW